MGGWSHRTSGGVVETGVVSYRSNYRAGSCKRSGVATNPQVTEIFPEPGVGGEAPDEATPLCGVRISAKTPQLSKNDSCGYAQAAI